MPVAFGSFFGNSPLRRDLYEQPTESTGREDAGFWDWVQRNFETILTIVPDNDKTVRM